MIHIENEVRNLITQQMEENQVLRVFFGGFG